MIIATKAAVASSAGEIPYWLAVTTGAGTKRANNLYTDATNLYVAGIFTDSNQDAEIFSMTKAGEVNWQRKLSTAGSDSYNDISVDASGNVYVTGTVTGSGSDIVTAKYDSSGTIQFQRTLATATYSDIAYGLKLGASDDIYIAGHSQNLSRGLDILAAKYNSSGTIQWQRYLRQNSYNDAARDLALDGSENPHIVGEFDDGGGGNQGILAKWNSAGTFQWQRRLATGTTNFLSGTTFDSSGAQYAVGRIADVFGDYSAFIMKLNATPAITWQRELDSASTDTLGGIATDSANNVYAVGYTSVGGVLSGLIVKYNSSGTLQWQRTISQTATMILTSIHIDTDDVMYLSGYTTISGIQQAFIARLPNDGSLTDTYTLNGVNHTYAAGSLTGSTPTHSINTPSLTAGTETLTEAAGTATDASTSIAFSKVTA